MEIIEGLNWKEQSREWKELAKFYKSKKEKYKWLYHIACLALHDTLELPLDEIKKDFEYLWDLKSAREEKMW